MNITICPADHDIYPGIAACFLETRGPNYYSAEYYDAEWLKHNCELFAALNDNGELVGAAGLARGLWDEEKTTGCLLTIPPRFAGNGIAKLLIAHFIGILKERGAGSAKGQVVTGHTAVQNIVEGFGWIPTGFLYGARDGKNLSPAAEGKSALVLYAGAFSAKDAGTLYIHKDIADPARRMYECFGVKAEFRERGRHFESALRHIYDAHNRALYIKAAECGADLTAALNHVRGQHPGNLSVTVSLDLGSPSAIYGYEVLREAGYRFCGFDPLGTREYALFYRGGIPNQINLTAEAETMRCEVDAI